MLYAGLGFLAGAFVHALRTEEILDSELTSDDVTEWEGVRYRTILAREQSGGAMSIVAAIEESARRHHLTFTGPRLAAG